MTYITRTLSQTIIDASSFFKIILVTGPRQVGKTTLLRHLQKERSYVTLDDINLRRLAQEDPSAFLQRLSLPVLIDEIQYAPELFPHIKMLVDQHDQRGLVWLTGSQQFLTMKNVQESLAGRVGIFHLQGISQAEEQQRPDSLPFLPEPSILKNRQERAKTLTLTALFETIWRGSYPDLIATDAKRHWSSFYSSYVSTYIQRDVREYLNIQDPGLFYKFIQVTAARTAQLMNYADIARDIGVSQATIKNWIHILCASGITFLLPPYFNNQTKRLIKTPKLYFFDTGLCCYLTGWLNADVLERGAMSGAMLKTWAISELLKSYYHHGREPQIYFYRDKDMFEIDVLIEENGVIYPIEIKKNSIIENIHFKGFDKLNVLNKPIGHGALLCQTSNWLPVRDKADAVPLGYL